MSLKVALPSGLRTPNRRQAFQCGSKYYNARYRSQPRQFQRTFVSSPTELQSLQASRSLSYPKSALFEIIADVGSYSKFVPYCTRSTVTRWSGDGETGKRNWPSEAELVVGWGGIEEKFTSKVICSPENETVEAIAGTHEQAAPETTGQLFKQLRTRWSIRPYPYKPPPTFPGQGHGAAVTPDQSSSHSVREQSDVTLQIEYQFVNPMYATLSKAVAPKVAELMIEAFEKRAKSLLDGHGSTR